MTFVVPLPPVPSLPVEGETALFPIRRVYCVGRNYAEHAREMGHDPGREPPFFFQKSPQNLYCSGTFPYPPLSNNVQFEVELLVGLRDGGRDLSPADAPAKIYGYGVALDMTRRDLQAEAKKLGRPWDTAKAFEHSAPASALVPASRIGHPARGAIWLDVNGARRQTGDLAAMIWDIPHQIAALSTLFELAAGDVLLTGTPAGVGAVARGDLLEAGVEGVARLAVRVT